METEDRWQVLLNQRNDKYSRLIFAGYKHRRLIDIAIQSMSVDNIVNAVLTSNWNAEQVIEFLNSEAEKVRQEASVLHFCTGIVKYKEEIRPMVQKLTDPQDY